MVFIKTNCALDSWTVQIPKVMFDLGVAAYSKALRNRSSLLIQCRSLVARVTVTVTSSLIMINVAGPWGPNRNSTRRLQQLQQQLQTGVDTTSIAWLITAAAADEVVQPSFSFQSCVHWFKHNASRCVFMQDMALWGSLRIDLGL